MAIESFSFMSCHVYVISWKLRVETVHASDGLQFEVQVRIPANVVPVVLPHHHLRVGDLRAEDETLTLIIPA